MIERMIAAPCTSSITFQKLDENVSYKCGSAHGSVVDLSRYVSGLFKCLNHLQAMHAFEVTCQECTVGYELSELAFIVL